MKFTHEYTIRELIATITVRGKLDHNNIIELEKLIAKVVRENELKHLVVDMSKSDYLPSFCFGVLISSADILKNKGLNLEVILQPYHANLAKSIGVENVLNITIAEK